MFITPLCQRGPALSNRMKGMKPHMENVSCKLDGGVWYKMHEPTVSPLSHSPSFSFYFSFFNLPPEPHSSSHFSLWARTAQTILSFSLSCLLMSSLSSGVLHVGRLNGSRGWGAGQEVGTRRRFRKSEETARGGAWSSGGMGEGLMPPMQAGWEEEEEEEVGWSL